MDQDKNNNENNELSKTTDQPANPIEAESNEADTVDTEATETPIESNKEPQVIINKSSNKLALLCALTALGIAAYLFFLQWANPSKPFDRQVFDDKIQQLTDKNKQLSEALQTLKKNTQGDTQNLQAEINQIKQLAQEASHAKDSSNQEATTLTQEQLNQTKLNQTAFNTAVNDLEQTLSSKLNDQASELQQLKQQLATSQNTPAIAQEQPSSRSDRYDTKHAIDALYAADLFIRTQRLPQAISTLQQLLATAHLKANTQQQIQILVNQWQQVKQPDSQSLFNQIQSLKQQISDITLPTQKLTEQEPSWYNRFISVKKIETEGALADSHALHLLKAQLTQHLLQAEWALTLKQGPAWNQQLQAAAQLTTQQLPNETSLINNMQQLANQPIAALLPTPSGIHDLINELKGQR